MPCCAHITFAPWSIDDISSVGVWTMYRRHHVIVMALASKMVPKEMNFFVPGAQGNTGTCTAPGFLITAGVTAVMAAYNCSICFYYLSIIRCNKKDEYTWFHGISILIIIQCIWWSLPPNTKWCTHCIGYESGETPEGSKIEQRMRNYGVCRALHLFNTNLVEVSGEEIEERSRRESTYL